MRKVFSKRLQLIAVNIAGFLLLSSMLLPSVACSKGGESVGAFFSLDEAYNNGLLTVQDLKSIASHYGSLESLDETFIPTPITPKKLSDKTQRHLKRDWAIWASENGVDTFGEKPRICEYYGTYGGCVAVNMSYENATYIAEFRPITTNIGGVIFRYSSIHKSILIWKNNK